MAERRYYWLKLQEDFFSSVRIKKLRKIAGGDTYTIIYLKMQLLSIRNGGILRYAGYETSFAEELALDLDEEVENVSVTLQYLLACGLIETSDNIEYLLPFAAINTGSEGSGAKRVREFRERQKALQSNGDVTQVKLLCNTDIEIDREEESEIEKEEKGRSTRTSDDEADSNLETVLNFYMDKFNPTPSSQIVVALQDYVESIDADVIIHAMQIALDERKFAWSYINAILKRYNASGLSTMEKVLQSEQEYQSGKQSAKNVSEKRREKKPEEYTTKGSIFDAD